jgi:hypothetical protein
MDSGFIADLANSVESLKAAPIPSFAGATPAQPSFNDNSYNF